MYGKANDNELQGPLPSKLIVREFLSISQFTYKSDRIMVVLSFPKTCPVLRKVTFYGHRPVTDPRGSPLGTQRKRKLLSPLLEYLFLTRMLNALGI